MKNHRGKRRKKGKALQVHANETLSLSTELNPLKEQVSEMKPGNLQFNLVCADHYSLYERTTVREAGTRREGANAELGLENRTEETNEC